MGGLLEPDAGWIAFVVLNDYESKSCYALRFYTLSTVPVAVIGGRVVGAFYPSCSGEVNTLNSVKAPDYPMGAATPPAPPLLY